MLAEQGQLARLVEQNVNLKKRQGAPIGRLQAKAISRDNRSKARAKRRRWKRICRWQHFKSKMVIHNYFITSFLWKFFFFFVPDHKMSYKDVIKWFAFKFIDENLPDLSGIPDFWFVRFCFSGYGHCHISGYLNFIKIIFRMIWSGNSYLWS